MYMIRHDYVFIHRQFIVKGIHLQDILRCDYAMGQQFCPRHLRTPREGCPYINP